MTQKPTAAKGRFPYPHRTVAEAMPLKPLRESDPADFVARSGFVERPPRNAEMDKPPAMTTFGRFKRRTWEAA